MRKSAPAWREYEMAGDDIGKHAMQSQSPPEHEVDTRIASRAAVCKRARRVL